MRDVVELGARLGPSRWASSALPTMSGGVATPTGVLPAVLGASGDEGHSPRCPRSGHRFRGRTRGRAVVPGGGRAYLGVRGGVVRAGERAASGGGESRGVGRAPGGARGGPWVPYTVTPARDCVRPRALGYDRESGRTTARTSRMSSACRSQCAAARSARASAGGLRAPTCPSRRSPGSEARNSERQKRESTGGSVESCGRVGVGRVGARVHRWIRVLVSHCVEGGVLRRDVDEQGRGARGFSPSEEVVTVAAPPGASSCSVA